jgi:hypothetical protein
VHVRGGTIKALDRQFLDLSLGSLQMRSRSS